MLGWMYLLSATARRERWPTQVFIAMAQIVGSGLVNVKYLFDELSIFHKYG
jgi:hypothetical protein